MALRTLAALAVTALLAPQCSAMPHQTKELASVNMNRFTCPTIVELERFRDLVPTYVKSFKCDWHAIDTAKQHCLEVEDQVVLFTKNGKAVQQSVVIGCFHVPMSDAISASTIPGEAD